MAHAQKPHFVFPRNGRVHSNRWGLQFSRLLAGEMCASALVMLDIPRSEVAWEYWLPTPFASFPFTSPTVRHRVPPGSERALDCVWNDGTRAETRFGLSAKRTSPFKSTGSQISRLLAEKVCASAVVMLDTQCSEVVWRVLATNSIRQFPFHFPSRVPSHFNWTLHTAATDEWSRDGSGL